MFFNPIPTEERVWETDNLFIERMTEDPFRVDTILFELLIDIFASGYGRTAVDRIRREVFGEVSDQSLDVIRGMKGCVRHYTGVVNIAFRSTLTPEEVELGLSEHLHDSYEYEFNNLESPKDRETVLARRFSTHYWQCAARQAATSRRICKLVFGLPDAIVEMLVNASTVQISKGRREQVDGSRQSDRHASEVGLCHADRRVLQGESALHINNGIARSLGRLPLLARAQP